MVATAQRLHLGNLKIDGETLHKWKADRKYVEGVVEKELGNDTYIVDMGGWYAVYYIYLTAALPVVPSARKRVLEKFGYPTHVGKVSH